MIIIGHEPRAGNSMIRRKFLLSLLSLLSLSITVVSGVTLAQTAVETPKYAGSWRVAIEGQAATAGTLQFALRPRSQPETVFSVAIAKDRAADGIARDIRTALRGKLDRHAYTLSLEGRSTLVFTAEMGTPRFDFAQIGDGVAGVQVTITAQ